MEKSWPRAPGHLPGCQRRGEKRRYEKTSGCPATVDWSYRANKFELGSRSNPVSWLEEPYGVLWLAVVNWQLRYVVIGCLLIDVMMLIDTYRSMIVRFASPATRGFLSPLLSLSSLRDERKQFGTWVRRGMSGLQKSNKVCNNIAFIHENATLSHIFCAVRKKWQTQTTFPITLR